MLKPPTSMFYDTCNSKVELGRGGPPCTFKRPHDRVTGRPIQALQLFYWFPVAGVYTSYCFTSYIVYVYIYTVLYSIVYVYIYI